MRVVVCLLSVIRVTGHCFGSAFAASGGRGRIVGVLITSAQMDVGDFWFVGVLVCVWVCVGVLVVPTSHRIKKTPRTSVLDFVANTVGVLIPLSGGRGRIVGVLVSFR